MIASAADNGLESIESNRTFTRTENVAGIMGHMLSMVFNKQGCWMGLSRPPVNLSLTVH